MDRMPADRTKPSEASTEPRRQRRWRALTVALVVVAVLAGIALLGLKTVLQPYVRGKLRSLVEDHLHAHLEVGSLSYRFPYGISVRDASFVTDASHGSVRLLTMKQLDVSLAELPLKRGPLVIERLSITEPVIHVVRSEGGEVVGGHLVKRGIEAPSDDKKLKLSDILRLREVNIDRATITYEDRARTDSVPMQWRDIDSKLRLRPTSASLYAFSFSAENPPIMQLQLDGTADVDTFTTSVKKLAMTIDVRRDQQTSPVPAQVQEILRAFGIEGSVRLDASGDMPLRKPSDGQFVADVRLQNVRMNARPTQSEPATRQSRAPRGPVVPKQLALDDLTVALHAERSAPSATAQPTTQPATQPFNGIELQLKEFRANGSGATIELSPATATINFADGTWQTGAISGQLMTAAPSTLPATAPSTAATSTPSLAASYLGPGVAKINGAAAGSTKRGEHARIHAQFTAELDHLVVSIPALPETLRDVCGNIRIDNQSAIVQNVSATYGLDRVTVNQAIISLADLGPRIEAQNIVAGIEFGALQEQGAAAEPTRYPSPIQEAVIDTLHPAGLFEFTGAAAWYVGRGRIEPDYALTLLPRGGAVSLASTGISASQLDGEVAIAPKLIEVRRLQGSLMDGMFWLQGDLVPRTGGAFEGKLDIHGADLSKLPRELGIPPVTGKARLSAELGGKTPSNGSTQQLLDTLTASGRLYIVDGDLWSLRVLDGITNQIKIARDALTAGEAVAVFDVEDRVLRLRQVAVSSAALGVQGSGEIKFDGTLNLDLIVAPLGDWQQKMRSTGIPVISEVAGDIVGTLQTFVNTATSQLLYQFRVEGKTKEPRITAVPAPILTESAASVFGMMLRGTHADKLFESPPKDPPKDPKKDNEK